MCHRLELLVWRLVRFVGRFVDCSMDHSEGWVWNVGGGGGGPHLGLFPFCSIFKKCGCLCSIMEQRPATHCGKPRQVLIYVQIEMEFAVSLKTLHGREFIA